MPLDDTTALFVYNSLFLLSHLFTFGLFFLQNAGDKVKYEIQSPYQELL